MTGDRQGAVSERDKRARQEEATMGDNSKFQGVSDEMRKMAEINIAKAKEAVDEFMKEASGAYEKVDASVQAARSGARDMNQMASEYAEANVNAAFDFAQKLVRARDPQEIVALQQRFLKAQVEQLNNQVRELGGAAVEAAKAARPNNLQRNPQP